MPVVVVDPRDPDPVVLRRAAAILRGGGLVAFPTETVYGLGANALDAAAVARIFAAKGRPSFNPLIVHVADEESARSLTLNWPPAAARLAAAFWPGPLTLVLPKHPSIPDVVTAGLSSTAVRVPAHPVARALIRAAGVPLAAPSANRSTELSPTRAEHVVESLGERIDLVLDGGPTDVGIESAVVDLTGPTPRLLRPGTIDPARLAEVAGGLLTDVPEPTGDAPRRAPGMLDRHYAPRAKLVLYDAADADRVAAELAAVRGRGLRTVQIAFAGPALSTDEAHRFDPTDPALAARLLYDVLHGADARGAELIVVERPPATAVWAGVADRLRRAAYQ